MQPSSLNCKNCGNAFSGRFCNNCGQKANVGTMSFGDIWHEGWHNLTHTDRGYLQLFWDLVTRPGDTIRNYLSGQRKRYFNPFTFYIVTTSLLILAIHLVFEREDEVFPKLDDEFGVYIGKNLNYILFSVLPLLSVVLWLFFRRSFRNLAEAFTTIIFAFGAANFFLLLSKVFFYFFIGLHHNTKTWFTLMSYIFILYILLDFIRPLGFSKVAKMLVVVGCFYFLVESVAKAILLMFYGVPFSMISF